jgi:hypothetical protein
MEEKKLYDDCFFVEEKKYGLWHSYDKEGKGLITALTEEHCVSGTRFYLKLKQDEKNGLKIETKTYSGEVGGKL